MEKTYNISEATSEPIIRFVSAPGKPLFAFVEKELSGELKHCGYFAYRLDSISQPRTKEEEEKLFGKSLEWHKNIADLLNNYFPYASFAIHIKNAAEKKSDGLQSPVKIDFVVRVIAKLHADLEKLLNKTNEELKMYLQKENAECFHPFIFSPVVKEDVLRNDIISGKQNYAVCIRPTLRIEKKESIGFRMNQNTNEKNSFLLPKQVKVQDFSMSSLLNILSSLNHSAEINLFLYPAKINDEYERLLKYIISHPGLLSDEFPTEEKRKEYIAYCRKFITREIPLFFAGVTFSSDNGESTGNVIKNAISNAFAGKGCEIRFFDSIQDTQYFLPAGNSNSEQTQTDFRFLFTGEDFLTSFRFPFPVMDGTSGIINKPVFSNNIPQGLSDNGILLGMKKLQNKNIPVFLSNDALRRHIYILGSTGTGKTTMLKTMLLNLIKQGQGCALIDPHGDLIQSVLDSIPSHRKNDVIYFDPTDVRNNKIRINILEYHPDFPEQRTFIFNELIKILKETYRDVPECMGPGFELYFRTFLLLVMDTIKGTLDDVMRTLKEKEFRKQLMEKCKDNDIVLSIENFLENTGEQSFQNWVPYLTNKFNRFVKDDFLGPIISEPVSNINFREIMDNKKILLVKLTKSRLGDEGVKFIGTIIFNRLIYAAYSRENLPEKERIDFTLFVDEFQNFTSSDINCALSESRKYHLRLCLANQTTTQLNDRIADSVLGNVGNFVSFRPGIPDINKIGAYFEPFFTAKELLEMPNYNCVARLLINNAPSKPFIFETKI